MRKEFELTVKEWKELLEASKPTMCIKVGSYMSPTPQTNANRAWGKLGKELGFKYMTVRPIVGKSQRFFTAEVA